MSEPEYIPGRDYFPRRIDSHRGTLQNAAECMKLIDEAKKAIAAEEQRVNENFTKFYTVELAIRNV